MAALLVFAALSLAVAVPQAKLLRAPSSHAHAVAATAQTNGSQAVPSFEAWYTQHVSGRGIWKWNNALVAYQRHFSWYIGKPVKFAEVGVQSGGSIQMWQTVLGQKCQFYGIDINPQTERFAEKDRTFISLGDQGDANMWKQFYTTTPQLDVLVDDGGHESHQMLTTLQETFPHISPGGFVSIEDIHGPEKYIPEFFTPAATYLGQESTQGTLASVHVYPFVLIVQRAGGPESHSLMFSGKEVQVSEFHQIWDAIDSSQNWGNHIVLRNPGWGPFLTAEGIKNFFVHFQDLHRGNWYDTPTGCERTAAALCTNKVVNSKEQAQVTGIHIYDDRLVVEVPGVPVAIEAVRRGTEWIGYGF